MSPHPRQAFLGCHDCGVLHLFPDSARTTADPDDEAIEAYHAFRLAHGSHHTEWLYRCQAECGSDRPLWDPMATLTFEVTDGRGTYVAQATRASIEEPRTYHYFPARLQVVHAGVVVATTDLRRGLDSEFYPHALRPTKLARFLGALQEVLNEIDPDTLPIAFDDADDPAISIACMPERVYGELLSRCAAIFDPWELVRVASFLRDNRNVDGLLALRVRRHIRTVTA
ncbi:MAG: hypothetical protein ACE5I7_04040 [Candidatus Binatia bacterium]